MQVTEVAREDPLQLSRNTVQEQTAVIAFTALYFSGLPFQVWLSLQACSMRSVQDSAHTHASVLSSCCVAVVMPLQLPIMAEPEQQQLCCRNQ